MEKDLSLKQQFLDIILIHHSAKIITKRLPDGFEELAPHNLVSFKSYREALDNWMIHELIGYDTNYRKQISPSMGQLLGNFHLHEPFIIVMDQHSGGV